MPTPIPPSDAFPGADRYAGPDAEYDEQFEDADPAEKRRMDELDRDDWKTHRDR